jgi:hypothetical protein
MKRTLTLLLVASLVLSAVPVAGQQIGPDPDPEDPQFETFVPEPTLTPGETQTLTVLLVNDDEAVEERVRTARSVEVTPEQGDTPFDIKSGTRVIDRMKDGVLKTVEVRLSVPTNVAGGTYQIPLKLRYEFEVDERRTTRVHATVRIEDRARFSVEGTESTVAVDGKGTVRVQMTNVGEEPANDASVHFESGSPEIRFGGADSVSRFVGPWEPGETKTIEVDASATDEAETRSYTINTLVNYEDEDGDDVTSSTLPIGVTPLAEQTFAVRDVTSTLRVDQEGAISGTVVNTGERAVENAVVVFEPTGQTVTAVETEYAVGRLEPGQGTEFSFDAEATSDADPGPRQFSFSVRYRDLEDERRTSDAIDVQTTVGEKRDEFGLEGVDATVEAGSSGQLQVRVTNNREERLTDISAKLYTESPLSTSDDEAFVAALDPGQSATLTFAISASGSALEKVYPAQVDFRYDDADGDTKISDTYQVPVQVTVPEDSGGFPLSLPVVGVLALVVVAVGGLVYRRR